MMAVFFKFIMLLKLSLIKIKILKTAMNEIVGKK